MGFNLDIIDSSIHLDKDFISVEHIINVLSTCFDNDPYFIQYTIDGQNNDSSEHHIYVTLINSYDTDISNINYSICAVYYYWYLNFRDIEGLSHIHLKFSDNRVYNSILKPVMLLNDMDTGINLCDWFLHYFRYLSTELKEYNFNMSELYPFKYDFDDMMRLITHVLYKPYDYGYIKTRHSNMIYVIFGQLSEFIGYDLSYVLLGPVSRRESEYISYPALFMDVCFAFYTHCFMPYYIATYGEFKSEDLIHDNTGFYSCCPLLKKYL